MNRSRPLLLAVAVLAIAWLITGGHLSLPGIPDQDGKTGSASDTEIAAGIQLLIAARDARQSDVQVLAEGRVQRLLADDNEGSRHQRLIVEIQPGFTILIAHNIDLAPRVDTRRGEVIRFYGEYEWTDRGGVVHWTHHDPRGRHPGGWIEAGGRRYE